MIDRSALRSTSTHVLVDAAMLDGAGGSIMIDDDTEHHLRRVLRLHTGEVVSATDGAGRWCLTTVVVDGPALRLDVSSDVVTETARPQPITVATAMPKGDRLDWLVAKVCELGIDRLVLLHAERSVVRWKAARVEQQLARMQRIADEALRQSRRVWRLAIDPPLDAGDVLADFVVAEPGGRRLGAGDVSIAIGPEGGWSPAELTAAADRVDLGATILRTETAAVTVSALCVALER